MNQKIMLFFKIKYCITWVCVGCVAFYTYNFPTKLHLAFLGFIFVYAFLQGKLLALFEQELEEEK